MTIRELIMKPFWTPRDIALIADISITSARQVTATLRNELEEQGYINLCGSKVPSKIAIERLNIDLDYLVKTGGIDSEL